LWVNLWNNNVARPDAIKAIGIFKPVNEVITVIEVILININTNEYPIFFKLNNPLNSFILKLLF
jgi:hypothetical protein